jgi:RNA polymerase sigma-70 factor (ECF subfamily)
VEWVIRIAVSNARLVADDGSDAGRAAAFRGLVGGELDRAYRRAAVILGDRFEAEDAVHDAAERAWRQWRNLRDPGRFEAWFGRILLNACRDRLRRQRRVRTIEVVREPVDGEHPRMDDASETVGLRTVLLDGFRALSIDERMVLALRYEADLTVPAIADLLEIAEGTVKSRLHNALRKLRISLGETL